MNKWKIVLFAILIHLPMAALSKTADNQIPKALAPDIMKCGVFPVSLYDLDIVNNQFSSSFYLWCTGKNPNIKIDKTLEVVNSLRYRTKFADQSLRGDTYLSTTRFFTKVYHEWDMTNFPFDKQTLKIYLEDGVYDTDSLRFVPDIENSRVADDLILDDWKLESFKFSEEPYVYATGFGNPKEQSTFSRLTLTFEIKRLGWRNFLSYFLGFFVAILLSLLACFIRSERFSIVLGAIFSLIGTKYVIDQTLPASGTLALSDHLEFASFAFVLITSLLVTIETRREATTVVAMSPTNLGIVAASLAAYIIYVGINVFLAYNS